MLCTVTKGVVTGVRERADGCAFVTISAADDGGKAVRELYEALVVAPPDGPMSLYGQSVEVNMTFGAPEQAEVEPEPEKPAKKDKKKKAKKEAEPEPVEEAPEPEAKKGKKKGKKDKKKKKGKKKEEADSEYKQMLTLLEDVDGLDEDAVEDLDEDGFLTVGSICKLTLKEFKKQSRLLKKSERKDVIAVLADFGWHLAEESAGDDSDDEGDGEEAEDGDAGVVSLHLSTRPHNALTNAGVTSLATVAAMSKREFGECAGLGRGGIVELCEKMEAAGYPIKAYAE